MNSAGVIGAALCVAIPYIVVAQTATPPGVSPSPIIERNKLVVQKFYPASSLRRGEEGRVGFTIAVNRDGRLNGCQVTQSSGYAALDKATCDMMLAGATGEIRRTADNRRVAYKQDGLVEWTLPEGVVRPSVKPPFNVATASAGEALVCRRQQKTGSLLDQKVCLTRDDWKRQEAYAQQETRDMQTPRGTLPQ